MPEYSYESSGVVLRPVFAQGVVMLQFGDSSVRTRIAPTGTRVVPGAVEARGRVEELMPSVRNPQHSTPQHKS